MDAAEREAKEEGDIGLKCSKKNFSSWYNEVVLKADLVDFSKVKGFMFIKPYGYGIWERIRAALDGRLKAKGHVNAYAPAVIPEKLLNREKEHVEGFAPEGFYVTETGSGKLAERLILRPTSETIIYPSYAKWVRSWRDLPVLWNYWNSVFRAEIKMTKLFLRTCEFLWQEGHTVHATEKEAIEEAMDIAGIYKDLMEKELAIPVIVGRKSDKEKFAGAVETLTLEAIMPDGRALQMGTTHNLGQNFSKAFGITYLDKKQKRRHAWQTSWGVSTRLIGATVMVHGDDKGLVLPPNVAPVQAVIVPIIYEKSKSAVLKKAKELFDELDGGFRVKLDEREGYTAGWKFNEWELKGVPVRLEIGPKDVEKKQVVLVRRDTGGKITVKENGVEKALSLLLEKMQKDMFRKADGFLKANITEAGSYAELKRQVNDRKMALAGWCGDQACEDRIQDETSATIRVIPFGKKAGGRCVCCGKKAKEKVYIGKGY
jgi:prolyl-tRNA synthetase